MDTTLSQVISLSKRFHPYRERSRDLRQTTLGRSNSFFERALPEKLVFGRANRLQAGSNTEKLHPRSTIHKTPTPSYLGEVQGETLDSLPLPHSAFMALHLDMTLVTQNANRPVGGRTSQFIPNWHKLTQDQWVLDTVQGYHLPLAQ